jgi:HlyD family secretion protein
MSEMPGVVQPPHSRRRLVLVILAVIVVGVVTTLALRGHGEPLHYFTTRVQRGEIRDSVDASGTVNAVITVQVGSQVSGTIAQLHADFNSRVRKDEVIAVIEPSLFDGALKQAVADLENSHANVVVAQAGLAKARANEVQTKAEYDRATTLVAQTVGTRQALDLAKANYAAAKASVEGAIANVTQARAEVRQREAAVSVARTNLAHTVIRSPIDGTVVARNVDIGQTVAASLQAPTIFTIAQDLTKMRVYAKVDESDVGKIHRGQEVTFKVDSFPKQLFHGAVSQVRMNPTTVQNVVTYDAVIDFDNPELKLFPGMTAYVTIPVATADNVMKVPNAALRYNPPLSPAEVRALYAKAGISEGAGDGSDAERGPRRTPRPASAVVWKLAGDTLEPVEVATGITDHTSTEVTKVVAGQLRDGDVVITSSVKSKSLPPGAQGFGR